jgi:hypothetical protein
MPTLTAVVTDQMIADALEAELLCGTPLSHEECMPLHPLAEASPNSLTQMGFRILYRCDELQTPTGNP